MVLGIIPTVDFVFKRLLGSPEHKAVTIHFLNAVLTGRPPIIDVEFENPILDIESEDDKLSILDVKVTDSAGHHFNIEMQNIRNRELPERLVFYVGQIFCSQLASGETYGKLKAVIGICVLNDILFSQDSELHRDFQMRDRRGNVLTDRLQNHVIELPKLVVREHNLSSASPLERWAFFLRNAANYSAGELHRLLPEPEFDEAVEVLDMIRRTPSEEEMYQARLKLWRDEESRLRYAEEKGREEARAEARIQLAQTLQQLLGVPETPKDELVKLEADRLTALIEDLKAKLRKRQP